MSFPKNFVWGVAAASYQIEGAWQADGKGPSVWDDFSHQPGIIYQNQNGDVACDHYNRFREDFTLMKELGIPNYRLSISWPRLIPEGIGTINEKGLDFYDRLIDDMLAKGIQPYVTLYHWDLPSALQARGSWENPDSPKWFQEYTALCAKRYGDRVKDFMTFNEPQCFIGMGYQNGEHAPGLKLPEKSVIRMAHHVLLAHGLAVQTLRDLAPGAKVSYAPTGNGCIPARETPECIEAARQKYFSVTRGSMFNVAWWSDPVMLGCYPEDGLALYEPYLPVNWQEDLKTICQPLDYYCQNIYNGRVYDVVDGQTVQLPWRVGASKTALDWGIQPKVLYWAPKFLYERYKKPIVISENGMANTDAVSLDGKVHDPQRVDYLHRYLREFRRAAEDGVEIGGYFLWSFMDNFEWRHGYNKRLGLVFVDFETQERIVKDSAYWYKQVIETNGEHL